MPLSDITDSVLPKPQLPVPIFLPVTPGDPDPTVKSRKKSVQPEPLEGELDFKMKFEMKKTQDVKNKTEDGQKDRVVTKEGQRQANTAKGRTLMNMTFELKEGRKPMEKDSSVGNCSSSTPYVFPYKS